MPFSPWQIDARFADRRRLSRWRTRHHREYLACLVNLQKVMDALNAGAHLNELGRSFLRSEGRGLFRIKQTAVPHACETRLYVFFHERQHRIFLLSIGDKSTQTADIRRLHDVIITVKKEVSQ